MAEPSILRSGNNTAYINKAVFDQITSNLLQLTGVEELMSPTQFVEKVVEVALRDSKPVHEINIHLNNQIVEKQKNIDKLNVEIKDLKATIERYKTTKVDSSDYEEVKKQNRELESRNLALEQLLDEKDNLVAELEKNIAEAEKKASTDQKTDLDTQISELKEKCKQFEEKVLKTQQRMAALEAEIEAKTKQINDLESDSSLILEETAAENESLKDQNNELKDKVTSITEQLASRIKLLPQQIVVNLSPVDLVVVDKYLDDPRVNTSFLKLNENGKNNGLFDALAGSIREKRERLIMNYFRGFILGKKAIEVVKPKEYLNMIKEYKESLKTI